MAKRSVDLFHAKRAEYISDIDRIGIPHRADRLRALDRVRACHGSADRRSRDQANDLRSDAASGVRSDHASYSSGSANVQHRCIASPSSHS
jgi:hypothetical protein